MNHFKIEIYLQFCGQRNYEMSNTSVLSLGGQGFKSDSDTDYPD